MIEQLQALLAIPGLVLLTRCRMPLGRGSIDLIAVGPGGVTVVSALLLRGRLTIAQPAFSRGGPERLLVAGRDHTAVVDEVERQSLAVSRALVAGARPAPPVRSALCVPGAWGLDPFTSLSLHDVLIDGPEAVARMIRRSGSLRPATVEHCAARLLRAFPTAGRFAA